VKHLFRVLCAVAASTFPWRTRTLLCRRTTVALCAIGVTDLLHLSLLGGNIARGALRGRRLSSLEVREMASFVVDIENLPAALLVESSQLLAGWGTHSLVKVRGETSPGRASLAGQRILIINGFGLVCDFVLVVEAEKGACEALRDAMLLIKGESLFNDRVADDVSMG
jgi:hypothetical protein